ncbi:MAG: GSCFA domain-containing protein [Prevotellaceae bacterium]|jgi:hypothetical protein|nr:GSCFA domain-containing protein [Prevotellaceae bacterium]
MKLSTEIKIQQQQIMSRESRFLLIGSCFAENIGRNLKDFRFEGIANPFGIMFNPMSIAQCLEKLLDGNNFEENDLFFYNNLWHSDLHHGSFSSYDKNEALGKINSSFCAAKNLLPKTDFLILTFGSAQVYLKEGRVAANCHKQPENIFTRKYLCVEEIVGKYVDLFEKILKINENIKIILSVSPVRYLRDGAHQNSLNKATLLLAVECLTKIFPQIIYFPAYEILLDELRDYRFFADDLIHPSPLAEKIVWQRFSETFFTEETKNSLSEIEKENKFAAHKPLH